MQLRPYQNDLVEQVRQAWREGYKAPCIVLGCGGGQLGTGNGCCSLFTGESLLTKYSEPLSVGECLWICAKSVWCRPLHED